VGAVVSGHTPGPWEVGAAYGMHGVEVVGDNGNRKVCGVIGVDRDQYDREGRKVANVPNPEGWANARLIAAAPDLLELAECVVSENPDYGYMHGLAVAAIAKATGAAP
jgi:hypothetical protein